MVGGWRVENLTQQCINRAFDEFRLRCCTSPQVVLSQCVRCRLRTPKSAPALGWRAALVRWANRSRRGSMQDDRAVKDSGRPEPASRQRCRTGRWQPRLRGQSTIANGNARRRAFQSQKSAARPAAGRRRFPPDLPAALCFERDRPRSESNHGGCHRTLKSCDKNLQISGLHPLGVNKPVAFRP